MIDENGRTKRVRLDARQLDDQTRDILQRLQIGGPSLHRAAVWELTETGLDRMTATRLVRHALALFERRDE